MDLFGQLMVMKSDEAKQYMRAANKVVTKLLPAVTTHEDHHHHYSNTTWKANRVLRCCTEGTLRPTHTCISFSVHRHLQDSIRELPGISSVPLTAFIREREAYGRGCGGELCKSTPPHHPALPAVPASPCRLNNSVIHGKAFFSRATKYI